MRIILILVFIASGCSVTPVRQYPESIGLMKEIQSKKSFFSGEIVDSDIDITSDKEISCRAMAFGFNGLSNYNEYLKKAIETDLANAGVINKASELLKITITGFELSSMDGKWEITTLTNTTKKKFETKTSFSFASIWMGDQACNAASNALAEATQKHIWEIFKQL